MRYGAEQYNTMILVFTDITKTNNDEDKDKIKHLHLIFINANSKRQLRFVNKYFFSFFLRKI